MLSTRVGAGDTYSERLDGGESCGVQAGADVFIALGCMLGLVAAFLSQTAAAEPSGSVVDSAPFQVVDLHVDLPYQFLYEGRPFDEGAGQFQSKSLLRAGVSGVVLPLFVPNRVRSEGRRLADFEQSYSRVFDQLIHHAVFLPPGCYSHPGRVRTWFSFEGVGPFSPADVLPWAARGVRIFGLVHNENNELMSSAAVPHDFGITERGRAVMREIAKVHGLIDVSHASDEAVLEATAYAKEIGAVVIATHSNSRALAANPRNLSDALMLAIAKTGGVIGMNFHQPYVVRGRAAALKDVVTQVQHALSVVGGRHVALGSDFEGDIRPAVGLENASSYPALARALLDAGIKEATVRDVFGKNALRLLCGEGF
ncbi:MAG: membrane dipeptidase [Polyangiaceae bacterium]|nr:membrane dipeptidase [Polyangiaceae bacterium]